MPEQCLAMIGAMCHGTVQRERKIHEPTQTRQRVCSSFIFMIHPPHTHTSLDWCPPLLRCNICICMLFTAVHQVTPELPPCELSCSTSSASIIGEPARTSTVNWEAILPFLQHCAGEKERGRGREGERVKTNLAFSGESAAGRLPLTLCATRNGPLGCPTGKCAFWLRRGVPRDGQCAFTDGGRWTPLPHAFNEGGHMERRGLGWCRGHVLVGPVAGVSLCVRPRTCSLQQTRSDT